MPEVRLEDTIAAISTPPGEGGIGIIRLSGPKAIEIAENIFRKTLVGAPPCGCPEGRHGGLPLQLQKSHTVHHGHIVDQEENVIDEVLVTVFRKPKSYTAEDVVEISAHGGSHVLKKILSLAFSRGARHAEPGEFTKRAFLNGRMDLAQAEAVLDLIRAKTDRSLEAALRQLEGKLSKVLETLKDQLMKLYAHIEAYLDFPDEHLEIYSNQEFTKRFQNISDQMKQLLASFSRGQILRDGAMVVIVGRPNVGKSSLLNALLEKDRALISEIPGTTRDALEESVEIEGLWIRMVDTAGLWSSPHPLDRAAMEQARNYMKEGDLFLWLVDASEGFLGEDKAVFDQLAGRKIIAVVNKIDVVPHPPFQELKTLVAEGEIYFLSAKTGEGIKPLEEKIVRSILEDEVGQELVMITRLRHQHALETALRSLEKSDQAFSAKESLEFVALDLKQALDSMRELIGEVYSEDLLDVIFSEFCIGK